MFAGFEARRQDLRRHPEDRVFEIDFQVVAQILAALRSVAPALAAAEQVA